MSVKKSLDENKNLNKFLSLFGQNKENLIMMEQVHGNRIKLVNDKDKGKVLSGIDGMVCNQPGITLGVKVADCLPILFYDKEKKVIGVAHAGWKGTLKRISQSMVKKMKLLGAKPENILVGIGPYIGSCCYTISNERADKFKKEFGNLKGMVIVNSEGIHLDLKAPTVVQLVKRGVRKNIDLALACTACQNSEFFSFRRNRGKDFGEILGVIGLV